MQVRLTRIQPSSTTLRYTFIVDGDIEYIHTSGESKRAELMALEALGRVVSGRGSIQSMDEGSLWKPEPGAMNVDFTMDDYNRSVYLIVADPEVGCPLRCPWCYARPKPVDAPIPERLAEERIRALAERVMRVVQNLASRTPEHIYVSIVLGGSTDPLVETDGGRTLYELFYEELEYRGILGFDDKESMEKPENADIYYAVSTSNPIGYLTTPVRTIANEVVVTYLPRELFEEHPMWRALKRYTGMSYWDYLRLMEEVAKKGATLAYIVYRGAEMPHVEAERYFLLALHPSNPALLSRLRMHPPRPEDVYAVLDYLVDEEGVRLWNIGLDTCSMILLGMEPRVAHEYETRNMIHCTPRGCRYARICPRGGGACVAEAMRRSRG